MAKVLVAEDDRVTRQLLESLLHTRGHVTVGVADGRSALKALREQQPDLVILDIGLPEMDGLDICEKVRQEPGGADLPIVLLTSNLEQAMRYEGFLRGADDYVSKPFDPVELLLRVDALLRRVNRTASESGRIVAGPYELDPGTFVFRSPDGLHQLTKSEFAILNCLMRKPGQVLGVDELLREALDYPRGVGSPDTVHTHIRKLRQKIEKESANPRIIRTAARLGYKFEPDPEAG